MRMRNENEKWEWEWEWEMRNENENENEKWWIILNVKDKSIMFGCISLNPVFLLNNECKKINIYIDTLKSAQVKVLCLLVLIE